MASTFGPFTTGVGSVDQHPGVPFTLIWSVHTTELTGARWLARVALGPLTPSERQVLEGFLFHLRGQAGRFLFSPPQAQRPDAPSGVTITEGLSVSGLAANAELQSGSYLSFPLPDNTPALHVLTADVKATAEGTAVLSVAPPLRAQPEPGTLVEMQHPQCIMRLMEDSQVGEIYGGLFGRTELNLTEGW